MMDHHQHITAVVRDELAKQCARAGVDKGEAGFSVGGDGAIMPVIDKDGQFVGFSPGWMILVSMRSRLIGYPPVAGSLPAYAILPADDMIREIVSRLVTEVSAARDQQFRGEGQ
jgi:hypothetical protein